MKKLIIAVSLVAAFGLGAFTAFLFSGRQVTDLVGLMMATSSSSDIMHCYVPLKLIDEGEQDKAIAFLESSLDVAISTHELQSSVLENDITDQDLVLKARALLERRRREEDTEHPAGPWCSPRKRDEHIVSQVFGNER